MGERTPSHHIDSSEEREPCLARLRGGGPERSVFCNAGLHMVSTAVPRWTCPACGATFDTVSAPGEVRPSPGDYTVCAECGALARFDAALQVVPLGADEHVPADVAQVGREIRDCRRRRAH